jgi:hypothetical protein
MIILFLTAILPLLLLFHDKTSGGMLDEKPRNAEK